MAAAVWVEVLADKQVVRRVLERVGAIRGLLECALVEFGERDFGFVQRCREIRFDVELLTLMRVVKIQPLLEIAKRLCRIAVVSKQSLAHANLPNAARLAMAFDPDGEQLVDLLELLSLQVM